MRTKEGKNMGKNRAFLEIPRQKPAVRPVSARIRDYREFEGELRESELENQAKRCMDCGVPSCHTGCPLGNLIPEFNELVANEQWQEAYARLSSTNNFPEFTGRVCPAPCEQACTLNLEQSPVNIKLIERQLASRAAFEDWIVPQVPSRRSGKKIAIVGSGPAGLACAQQLARAGHDVTVFERDEKPGGLLRYGIPDFKLEKSVIDRRIRQMKHEGVHFRCSTNVGIDISAAELRADFDSVVLCGGASAARDLPIPGRTAQGIHLAMDFLAAQNRVVDGLLPQSPISAEGKHVVVLGGGDTGSDCVGTSIRQGCISVVQLELMPRPPEERSAEMPWPYWPMILRTSSSQEEGCDRDWSVATKRFISDEDGKLRAIEAVRVEWLTLDDGRKTMREVENSTFRIEADICFLALGFVGPEKSTLLRELDVLLDERGNVKADSRFRTSVPGVFACGDLRRGQSLVVWAIWEGRQAAAQVDAALMGRTYLPIMPHDAELRLG
jgi:glutamate synthase (NADPH/NADH) small chain